jgi:hypothetical protein
MVDLHFQVHGSGTVQSESSRDTQQAPRKFGVDSPSKSEIQTGPKQPNSAENSRITGQIYVAGSPKAIAQWNAVRSWVKLLTKLLLGTVDCVLGTGTGTNQSRLVAGERGGKKKSACVSE